MRGLAQLDFDKVLSKAVAWLVCGTAAFALPYALTSVFVPTKLLGQLPYQSCAGVFCSSTTTEYKDYWIYVFGFSLNSIFDEILTNALIGIVVWVPSWVLARRLLKRWLKTDFSMVVVGALLGLALCIVREFLRSEWRAEVWVGTASVLVVLCSGLTAKAIINRKLDFERL